MNVSAPFDKSVRPLPQGENVAKPLIANKRPFPQADQSPFQMSKTSRDQSRPQQLHSQSAQNLFSKSHNSYSDSYAVFNNNGPQRPNKRCCIHEEENDDKENTHRNPNTPKRRESLCVNNTTSPESAKLNLMMMNLSLANSNKYSNKEDRKLKCFQDPSRPEFNSIYADVVADLVRGKHDGIFEKIFIIDCRYGYEFVGGHIAGACNFPEGEGLETLFEEQRMSSNCSNICFVFHCEFSSHRGPYAYNKFKEMDRKLNGGGKNCETFTFPEIYLLVKGYKGFYTDFSTLCEPQNYRTMDDVNFSEEYKRIKQSKKNITEPSKSRIPHCGLSKSSMNLFGPNYKDSPSKDNDIFADTPKKEIAQSKRNLFNDLDGGALFSPSPAPNKCESKVPLLFEDNPNQEFHKMFGDDAINSLHFEALTLNETKEPKKKESEGRIRRNSVKMLVKPAPKALTRSSCSFSNNNHHNSSFEDMNSPFKSKETQKPPSCKDLFNTKGTSPRTTSPTSTNDFHLFPAKSEPTLIPRRSLTSSNSKIRECQSEPNMFMDEDIDTSQTPFRPFNSGRNQSHSFDMSTGPLRNPVKGDSFLIHHQRADQRPQSCNLTFNVSSFNKAIGDCVNSHFGLFGSDSSPQETTTNFVPGHTANLSNSSAGNGSNSGYNSLSNSSLSASSRGQVQKLDLNFHTRSDPGIDTHRNGVPSRLVNSSRGPDSARSYDSVSRSNSIDGDFDRSFSRPGPNFDEIQTPFKPASLTKSNSASLTKSNSASLTKSNSGSLEREGSGHLKLSGKGTNRRALEIKRDILEDKGSLRLRSGSLGDLRRPQPQLVMTKKRELSKQIVTNNNHSNRSSPSDKKDWANHFLMKSSPPPSSNHSPLQSTSWSGS